LTCPVSIADDDVDALRVQFSDDEVFELMVAAAFGPALARLAASCMTHKTLERRAWDRLSSKALYMLVRQVSG
jgi:hypothetical protein